MVSVILPEADNSVSLYPTNLVVSVRAACNNTGVKSVPDIKTVFFLFSFLNDE